MLSISTPTSDLSAAVEKDGFFVERGCLDVGRLQSLRTELEALIDDDMARRSASSEMVYLDDEGVRSDLTPPMHNILFPAFKNRKLASVIVAILQNESITDMLRTTVGDRYRLRVDLVRRSTGVDDYCDEVQLPHQWHRDSPGEFTFGFFLDDFRDQDSGGTAVVPGTHWNEYNPVWDFLIGPESRTTKTIYQRKGKPRFRSFPNDRLSDAPANHDVRMMIKEKATAIRGEMGDLFFFLNDVYHGRWPNRTGRKLMLVRVGAFSCAFPFKADLALPTIFHDGSTEFLSFYMPQQKSKPEGTPLIERIASARKSSPLLDRAAAEKIALVEAIDADL